MNKKIKVILILMILAIIGTGIGITSVLVNKKSVNDEYMSLGDTVSVESITLSKTSVELEKGGFIYLLATVKPSDATDKTVTWNSNATSIATVDNSGKVTAVGYGTATITATSTLNPSVKATCTITVKSLVENVTLSSSSLVLDVGESYTLVATVTPESALNKTVIWSSSDSGVASVDENTGKITAHKKGTITITATTDSGAKEAKCTVTVVQPVTEISLSKTNLTLNKGSRETITATVTPEDASNKTVTWSSSDKTVATVDENTGEITAIAEGSVTIIAKSASGNKTASCEVKVVDITSISFSEETYYFVIGGGKYYLNITAKPFDVGNSAITWNSSNKEVATVNEFGVVTALAVGETTITAEFYGLKDTCKIIVSEFTSTSFSKEMYYFVIGGTYNYLDINESYINLTLDDFDWNSSNKEVATVESGFVTLLSAGETTITAEFNGLKATCEVTVVDITSITFMEETLTLALGGSGLRLTIKEIQDYDNLYESDFTWESSKTEVATVDKYGTVTPVSDGTTVITAEFNGVKATCKVIVEEITSISLSKETLNLLTQGVAYDLTINETFENFNYRNFTWTSSDSEVASVTKKNSFGVVEVMILAHSEGEATITAEFNGLKATCKVTVSEITSISLSKETLSLALGTENYSLEINNIQEYDNIQADLIIWNSSNKEVATVEFGLVKLLSDGETTITAEYYGMKDTCKVTVTAATVPVTGVSLNKNSLALKVGGTETLTATVLPSDATNKKVSWSSTNQSAATVDNGTIKAIGEGETTIIVTTEDGSKTATCTVTVTASGTSSDDTTDVPVTGIKLSYESLSLSIGKGHQLKADILPSNATNKTVNWLTNNPSVATVSKGYITAVGVGEAWITARIGDVYARCTVTVTGTGSTTISVTGLTLDKTNLSLKTGSSGKLNVTVNPTNATNQNVYWSSNDNTVVSVDQEGNIKALKSGTATVTVNSTSDTTKFASCTITVTDEEVEESNVSVTGISLKDTKITLNFNGQYQLAPTITPSNATNQSVIWNSSDESVATVTNGIVNALKEGSTTITVTTVDGSKTATCNVTVTSNYADVTLSNINTLSSLDLGEFKIDFFSPETLIYNITVPSTVNSVTIDSTLTDVNSKYVDGYGNRTVTLNNIDNVVLIKVKAENGDIRTYTLNIKRSSDIKNLVSNITIDGYKINFKNSVKEYDLKIKNEKSLDINVTLTDNKYTYNILNNEDLIDGKVIIIKAIGDNMIEEYKFNISTSNVDVPITSLDSPTIILIGSIVLGIIGFGIIYFTKLRKKIKIS